MARHRAREQALQLLFQWDVRRTSHDEILRGYYESLLVSDENPAKPHKDAFAEVLFRGVTDNIESIDEQITKHAAHWKIPRMPAVDRNILRLAVYEILHTETPPAVTIDEALEIARRFAGEESIPFLNGVLDAVRLEFAKTNTAASH